MGWEDPLEKEMATHSSTLAWKILWTEKPGRLQSMGLQSQTRLSNFPFPHVSKVMIKILQARLQQYMNHELPVFKLVIEKAEEPENKLPTSTGSSKKRVPEKHLLMLY